MAVTAESTGTKTTTIGTFTVTIASPGVFTYTGHQLANGDIVSFTTTGALPTGLSVNTNYYVVNSGTDGANNFRVESSIGGGAINTSGSQSGTHSIIAEHFLDNVAAAGTYTLHVDTNAMAAGDIVLLRCYQMVLTGGTARVAYANTYSGAQPDDDKIKISVPISNELTDAQALRFSIQQVAGAARAFPWKVLKYA